MEPIISKNRSLIISCDVDFVTCKYIVEEVGDLPGVGAFKLGAVLGLTYSLSRVVGMFKQHTDKPLIYDHQAAGTDISFIGKKISRTVRDAGLDAIIFKPKKDKLENLRESIKDAQDVGLKVMVVGKMTDEVFSSKRNMNQSLKIYETAFEEGVYNFGVPGNDLKFLDYLKKDYSSENINYFPIGIGSQEADIEEIVKVLKDSPTHPIVGRGIYEALDMRRASLDLINKL